mgnify:CR=1 FL=1
MFLLKKIISKFMIISFGHLHVHGQILVSYSKDKPVKQLQNIATINDVQDVSNKEQLIQRFHMCKD